MPSHPSVQRSTMIRAASAVFAWLCVAAPLSHAVMTDGTFAINREVVAAGGSTMSSGVFSSTGTVGQGAIGDAAGAAFALSAGFWPDVAVIITFAFAPQSNAPLAAPGAGQPSSCGCASASQFIALVGAPRSPQAGTAPLGVAFPYGLFDFSLVGCAPGGSVTLTITYPQAVPPGAQYWKYGPTS